MKIHDDKFEDLESQKMENNSRLEELLKDLNEGSVDLEKEVEFLKLIKKSQLIMPVVFSPNMEELIDNHSPGEILVAKHPIGFNINYIELSEDERAIPLFTSNELMKNIGLQSSIIKIYMVDLADLLKKTDKYSLVVINPFTDLLIEMPINYFLALFNEM